MGKKLFDILPPEHPTAFQEKEEERPLQEKVKLSESFSKKKWREMWWLFIPLILILVIAFCFEISKVEIKIWPETETVTFRTKVTIDKVVENPDFENKVIPGKIFEIEKIISGEFSSSGKLLKKAEGIIRLYNNYTAQAETWRKETRFVSTDGKLFKSKAQIFVPAAEIKNGKIVPSYVDVPVIADKPGSDYNIGPSHFSIIALRGTPRYTKFYGESFEPMSGGGEMPQVTKEDLENSQALLIEKAKTEIEEDLKNKIPAEFSFLKEISETKILEKSSSVSVGAEVEKFNVDVKVKSTTLSFRKEDIGNFAKEFILFQTPEDKNLYQESLKIDYFPETVNFNLGKLSLSLNLSAKIYPKMDLVVLKKGLVGKSLAETKIFLENQPQIIKVELRFSPFWVKKVPERLEKIELRLNID